MDRFKLIDEIGAELGAKAETRRKWRERQRVAVRWRNPIIEKARARGVELTWDDFGLDVKNAPEISPAPDGSQSREDATP